MLEDLQDLEWTGERYLPWIRNAALAYEHLHRYAFAARFARDKHVLDLGSGEGYGANILARTASSVLGVDIDSRAIRHAAAKYRKNNLKFDIGSFAQVPVSQEGSFDMVVCFEAIEHIHNQDQLLGEVKRLLRPDGLFMVSTPNKSAYQKESEEHNPYHVNELEPEEFQQLLGRYFRESRFLGQRIHPGSSIWPLEPGNSGAIEELTVQRGLAEFEFIENQARVPVYIVALASDSTDTLIPAGSVLIDSSNELLLETRESVDEIISLREDLDRHMRRLDEMHRSVSTLNSDLQATQTRMNHTSAELESIYSSNTWKVLNEMWRIRDGLLPPASRRRQLLQRLLTFIVPDSK